MKSVNRYIPEIAFQRIEEQYKSDPPLFSHEKEVFYFIVDLFFRLKAYNKNIKYTSEGLITISSKYFSSFITKNYANYLRWLVNHQVIVCDKIKKTGKSFGYELHPNVQSKLVTVVIPSDRVITRRIITNYNRRMKYHKKLPEHIRIMKNHFKKNINVDLNSALQWMEDELQKQTINLNQYNVYYMSLHMIQDKEMFFQLNKTNGRIDSNITNLKSDLRQFLTGNLIHIDCKSSQPLIVNFITDYIINNNLKKENPTTVKLLSSCLPSSYTPSFGDENEKILSKHLSMSELRYLRNFPLFNRKSLEEFTEFRRVTFHDDFYNSIKMKYELLYKKTILRNEIKEIVYKVFFSKNTSYKSDKKIFRQMFPVIYKIIYNLKNQQHNKFALCLQSIESDIFIQKICKRLVENGIVPITIHDSVIVASNDQERTLEIIAGVYKEIFGEIPQMVCKLL